MSRLSPAASRAATATCLLACTLWFFAPLVWEGQVLFERDVGLLAHASTESIVRAVGEGSLPWWDPNPSFGIPVLEQPDRKSVV